MCIHVLLMQHRLLWCSYSHIPCIHKYIFSLPLLNNQCSHSCNMLLQSQIKNSAMTNSLCMFSFFSTFFLDKWHDGLDTVVRVTTANIQTASWATYSGGVSLALSYFGAPVCCSDFSSHPGLNLERQFQVWVRHNLESCNFSFSENVSNWDSGVL